MSKRINITLPDTTLAVLDRVTTKGNRSRFIDRAVRRLVEAESTANLRARLKEEALANAERDLAMAAEWFPLEQEVAEGLELDRRKKPLRKRT
jgi:CopG family transcriptional regulator / antitoxin EndoAI